MATESLPSSFAVAAAAAGPSSKIADVVAVAPLAGAVDREVSRPPLRRRRGSASAIVDQVDGRRRRRRLRSLDGLQLGLLFV